MSTTVLVFQSSCISIVCQDHSQGRKTWLTTFKITLIINCYNYFFVIFQKIKQVPFKIETKFKTAKMAMSKINGDTINRELSKMVYNAKQGDWQKVYSILNSHPILVNMIPTERAWSALHQAVYHRNVEVIKKLISYKECDVFIRAKGDLGGSGVVGMTPRALAEKFKYSEIANILKEAENNTERKNRKAILATTKEAMLFKNQYSLFYIALAQYKEILLGPGAMDAKNLNSTSILREVFNYQSKNWKKTQLLIRENLVAYTENADHRENVWFETTGSCAGFYTEIIKLYTSEQDLLYKGLGIYEHFNNHLRQTFFLEDGSCLLLLPFLILFQCVLLFWDHIKSWTGASYRGMVLSDVDVQYYKSKVGLPIEWMSFTSASVKKNIAEHRTEAVSLTKKMTKTLFIMTNNKCQTAWQPKLLGDESSYSSEQEVVYPAGAIFKITKITYENNRMNVRMDLAGPTTSEHI